MKSENLFVFVLGIFIYPLAMWNLWMPTKQLSELGFVPMLFAWLISAVVTAKNLFRIKSNYRKMLFWFGFMLHLILFVAPIAFLFLIRYSGLTH